MSPSIEIELSQPGANRQGFDQHNGKGKRDQFMIKQLLGLISSVNLGWIRRTHGIKTGLSKRGS